jgi:hypothetical protein
VQIFLKRAVELGKLRPQHLDEAFRRAHHYRVASGAAGFSRAPEHPAHGALYQIVGKQVQEPVARLSVVQRSG